MSEFPALASHFSPLSPLGVSFLSVVTSWRLISLRCHLLASRFTNPLNADTHLSYSPTCTLTTDSQVNKSYLDSTHNTMFSHTKKIFESFSTTFPLFLLSPLSSFLKIFPFFPPFHLSPSFLSSFSSFPILSSFLFIFPPSFWPPFYLSHSFLFCFDLFIIPPSYLSFFFPLNILVSLLSSL